MLEEIAKWLWSAAILGLIVTSGTTILYLFVNWPQYLVIGGVIISLIAMIRFGFFLNRRICNG